jgi:hypothetical protein
MSARSRGVRANRVAMAISIGTVYGGKISKSPKAGAVPVAPPRRIRHLRSSNLMCLQWWKTLPGGTSGAPLQ